MCALHRSWQKFEDLQQQWAAREKVLQDEVGQYKSDALVANSVMEENADLKAEMETAKKVASEAAKEAKDAIKEAKEKKEELRTCRLDRDYHADLANQKSSLADDLQKKCEQLTAEVESLKESHAKALSEQAEELEDAKDAIKVCFYMFWKHNRNADFSYLGDAYADDEAECLERLAEEEVEAAATKGATSQDPQDPKLEDKYFYFSFY